MRERTLGPVHSRESDVDLLQSFRLAKSQHHVGSSIRSSCLLILTFQSAQLRRRLAKIYQEYLLP